VNRTSRHLTPSPSPCPGEGGKPVGDQWLALAIGNSRLHWAWFNADRLIQTDHTPHIEPGQPLIWPWSDASQLPLFILSVVPAQTALWQESGTLLTRIPLDNAYAELGADRACALWGAFNVYGSPVLVIDGGTALTFTGGDAQRSLVGGAILPGLSLQVQSLARGTALLPSLASADEPPDRWATNTSDAIRSGILWSVVAGVNGFIEDWLQRFPDSRIVMTGGDAERLYAGLIRQHPEPAAAVIVDSDLVFWGMRALAWSNYQPEPVG
jgi:type III pantothenate kinase